MELTTLCAVVAALKVIPDRSQFFTYEPLSLSCGEPGNFSEWRVKRNTSRGINEGCSTDWGERRESQCFIQDIYPSDTGVYWCESGAGECSDAVNITVTGGSVILESPVLPVQEGDAVTLRCTKKATSSANLTAEFYKGGLLIGSSSTGNLTLYNVCESDESYYNCNIPGEGKSPDSWLAVRRRHELQPSGPPESNRSLFSHIVLPVVGACLTLASLMLLCVLWRSHEDENDLDVSYTDVTITQPVQPKRETCAVPETDPEPTIYSTIKPGAT